ncbi:MAG: hypothetical protein ACLP4V_06925 [Methylocella sp.]
MIELLRIQVLIRVTRLLIFVGRDADRLNDWCLRKATTIAAEAEAWADARDTARQ